MKLFIDNTGFHSVGRCLDGEATGELDIAGLLQFATQLVFSDELFYAAFCSSGVAARSQDANAKVSKLGVGSDVLRLSPFDAGSYERAGLSAGKRLASDLEFSFMGTATQSVMIAKCLPDFNPLKDRDYDKLHQALKFGTDSARSELLAEAANIRLIGSAAKLVTMSDNLWIEASRLARSKSWKKAHTAKLVVMMRCYLNQELATQLSRSERDGVDYSPSVGRARIIQAQDAYMLVKLSEIIGRAAHKLEAIKLEAPPIALALALKAKGDPRGVITEALIAREKAVELRRYLQKIVKAARKEASTDIEALKRDETIDRLRNAAKELATLLDEDLGIAPRVTLRDALEANMVGPVPIPPPRKMLEWVLHKWNRSRITILSEFARRLANPIGDKFALQKLYANCQRAVHPSR